jgi:mannosyltransferase OCH1-like enzyme
MIPKKIHVIWIGDKAVCPWNCINTWRTMNPTYEFCVWDNDALKNNKWVNAKHIKALFEANMLSGVADLMRYEILYSMGGVTVDADSKALRPLEDWVIAPREFACWESEILRPGLIACGVMGSVPKSQFFDTVIKDIKAQESVVDRLAWESVGPMALTNTWQRTHHPMTIYPSHFFIPNHFNGAKYENGGVVFCEQFWGSTFNKYDSLHQEDIHDQT